MIRVAYQQIADYLDGGALPHCSGDAYLAVNEIGFGTIENGLTGETVELPNASRSRRIYANG